MATTTPNLGLSVTPESTNKSFKAWRLEMDNDTNSNMTKIDAAVGDLKAGNLGGSVTMTGTSPRITLLGPTAEGETTQPRAQLIKSASTSTDYGTFLVDMKKGDGSSENNPRVSLRLNATASALKDRVTIQDVPLNGNPTKYYCLYGEHNHPAINDVTNLQTVLDNKYGMSGGVINGNVDIEKNSFPMIMLGTPAVGEFGATRTTLQKIVNAEVGTDSGTILFDYTPGLKNHIRMYLKAGATTPKEMLYLHYVPESGSGPATTYYLYGDHNKPNQSDIQGLDTHYAKISTRTMIRSGEDLNTYVTAGCYQSYSTAEARQILNTPEANASTHVNAGIMGFKLDVEHWGGATYSQTLTTMNAIQYMRYTSNTGSAWGAWIKMTP